MKHFRKRTRWKEHLWYLVSWVAPVSSIISHYIALLTLNQDWSYVINGIQQKWQYLTSNTKLQKALQLLPWSSGQVSIKEVRSHTWEYSRYPAGRSMSGGAEIPLASSQHQLAIHLWKPPWERLLQLKSSLLMIVAQPYERLHSQ